ncbi:hypothetical protein K1T71_014754 [Dendrolimus kikuchii]|nr:hypothetical protein K1T71_014754 [Dendrolimus kikuchii]
MYDGLLLVDIIKMDGDIDINEHDILDNPQISNIFPDLSKIKSEFVDDDVTIVEHSPDLEIKQEVDYVDERQGRDAVCKRGFNNTIDKNVPKVVIGMQNSGRINNHTALSSNSLNMSQRTNIVKTSDASLFAKDSQNIALENAAQVITNTRSVVKRLGGNSSNSVGTTIVRKSVASKLVLKENKASNSLDLQSSSSKFRNYIIVGGTNNDNKPEVSSPNVKIMSNKIILGSKAPPVKTKEYLPALVLLKDCRTVLKATSRYCDSCKILFPTKNGFDAHKTSTHSASIEFTSNAVVDTESDNDSEIMEFKGSEYSVNCEKSVDSINTKNMEMNKCVNKRKLSEQDEESINSAKRFRNAAKNIKNIQNSISNFDGVKKEDFRIISITKNNSAYIAAAALKDYNDDEPVKLSIKDVLQRKRCGKKDRSMNREISDVNESSVDSKTAYDDKQFEIQDIKPLDVIRVQ